MKTTKPFAWNFVALALCACMALCIMPAAAAQNCNAPGADPNCGVYSSLPQQPTPVAGTDTSKLSDEQTIKFAYDLAQGRGDPTGKVMDVAIAAITVGYPPAGIALEFAKGLITAVGGGSDPVGDALQAFNTRLDILQARLAGVETALRDIRDQQFRSDNHNRQQRLLDFADVVAHNSDLLKKPPTDQGEKNLIVRDLQRKAARFLEDPDLWKWSDLHIYTVTAQNTKDLEQGKHVGDLTSAMLDPDFKTLPTFEYYLNTLVLWTAAIEYASGGRPEYVTGDKSLLRDLYKHAAFLSIEPTWREMDADAVTTLPEQIMRRINCQIEPVSKYPDPKTGICSANLQCVDLQRHTVTPKGATTFRMTNNKDLCQYSMRDRNVHTPSVNELKDLASHPRFGSDALALWQQWDMGARRSVPAVVLVEQEKLESEYGVDAMTQLADKLVHLAKAGSLAEQFIGRFDMTFYTKQFLYGLKPNGELLWYDHVIGVDKNPPQQPSTDVNKAKMQTSVVGKVAGATQPNSTTTGPATRSRSMRTGPTASPQARVGAEQAARRPAGAKVIHKLEGPKLVGTGWQNFREVIPAGASGFYGLTADGSLLWYRHDGFADGAPRWAGPIKVASGWNAFRKIVAGGDGVLYGIGPDGSLQWYRHGGYADATHQAPPPTPHALGKSMGTANNFQGPRPVGTGWGNYVHVFSTGEGVIYAVTPDGRLMWYRHLGYLTGTPQWQGPKQIGTGWANLKRVFSPGTGVIYAMPASGELLWYQNDGYLDGTPRWQGPTKVAADWSNFMLVFPRMWGTPQPTQVH